MLFKFLVGVTIGFPIGFVFGQGLVATATWLVHL